MSANGGHQSRKFRSTGYAFTDQPRGNVIRDNVPGGIGGFGIVKGIFVSGYLAPPAQAIGVDFNEKNPAIVHHT